MNLYQTNLYFVSSSPGSDVSTQKQLVSACTQICFNVRTISLGARDLELRLAYKRAMSLPGDSEAEYTHTIPDSIYYLQNLPIEFLSLFTVYGTYP